MYTMESVKGKGRLPNISMAGIGDIGLLWSAQVGQNPPNHSWKVLDWVSLGKLKSPTIGE